MLMDKEWRFGTTMYVQTTLAVGQNNKSEAVFHKGHELVTRLQLAASLNCYSRNLKATGAMAWSKWP